MAEGFGVRRIITPTVLFVSSVHAADVDGDDDLDVVWSSVAHGSAWPENTDGLGSFGPIHLVGASTSLYMADVDDDGDADLLSAEADGVAWYDNVDGLGSFETRRDITTSVLHTSTLPSMPPQRDFA